ncbi:hypothetical protein CDD81_5192 [Ophiocordyceps australis]|uniref:Pinin/SDK/MemA protein domain-containing protein n=1 Tax=Ophiocordyceps australis TaxID=1399860 RepID=A0A2C5Y8M4_9HYPO|nr:hypothetical protein CDD81_5192 [Ophiocordyceps australis]
MAAEDETFHPETSRSRSRPRERKRRASSATDGQDGYAKRRHMDYRSSHGPTRLSESPEGPLTTYKTPKERKASVTQEDKKRGQRLFGGLLSTLSQTNSSSQQRRRQEIERRQLDKLQQQTAQDEKKLAERRAAAERTRLCEQITWEERVMRNRHAKELKLAQFLQTSSRPQIYFLPWRLSRSQEDEIDNQIRDTKARIARELENFKSHKEDHVTRYGPASKSEALSTEKRHDLAQEAEPVAEAEPELESKHEATQTHKTDSGLEHDAEAQSLADVPQSPKSCSTNTATIAGEIEGQPMTHPLNNDDLQDDLGDILVEAEEDMVIY